MLIIALTAMTSCSDNDNEAVGPATKAQYEAVTGHWYAEIPISGETDNWRTQDYQHALRCHGEHHHRLYAECLYIRVTHQYGIS